MAYETFRSGYYLILEAGDWWGGGELVLELENYNLSVVGTVSATFDKSSREILAHLGT